MNATARQLWDSTILLVTSFMSASGPTAHTTRSAVALESIPASSRLHPTNVASVERDEAEIWLMNVGTPPLGKFDDADQDTVKASLQDTLKAAMRGRVVDSAGVIDVHLSIRKYFVATTNTAVAVFATRSTGKCAFRLRSDRRAQRYS